MGFLRCALSEWPFLRTRLLRTRLGVWLPVLFAATLWLERTAALPDSRSAALYLGGIGAILCVGYLAGARQDRIALSLALLHPRSPGAVALGRWLAVSGGAALVVVAGAAHAAWTSGSVTAVMGATLAGLITAVAVGAVALPIAWSGGNTLVGAFLVWIVLFGGLSPEAVLARADPGVGRIALAVSIEVLPGPWRYRGIATGDVGAMVHAALCISLGLGAARWRVARAGHP